MINAFFDAKVAKGLGAFDAINLSNVLEHIPRPTDLLAAAIGLLANDGLLCICVPNDYNPLQKTLRNVPRLPALVAGSSASSELFYVQQCREAVARRGLVTLRRLTSFPMDMLLLLGHNYVNNPDVGRETHRRRKDFEFALENAGNGDLRRTLYQSLANLGIGREVIVYRARSRNRTEVRKP